MIQVELTHQDIGMLREVLASHLSELRMEIAHTDRRDFRDYLRRRRDFLERFLLDLERNLAAAGNEPIHGDRLRRVEILRGLTDWELSLVAQYFQEERVPGGVTLCQEGGVADRLYILEEGTVTLATPNGDSYQMKTSGKVIGWSFLVSPNLYTATATTVTPCRLLVMQSPDFYYLIHKDPRMGVKVMDNLARVVASRIKDTTEASSHHELEDRRIA